jgi:hypothetical protein
LASALVYLLCNVVLQWGRHGPIGAGDRRFESDYLGKPRTWRVWRFDSSHVAPMEDTGSCKHGVPYRARCEACTEESLANMRKVVKHVATSPSYKFEEVCKTITKAIENKK